MLAPCWRIWPLGLLWWFGWCNSEIWWAGQFRWWTSSWKLLRYHSRHKRSQHSSIQLQRLRYLFLAEICFDGPPCAPNFEFTRVWQFLLLKNSPGVAVVEANKAAAKEFMSSNAMEAIGNWIMKVGPSSDEEDSLFSILRCQGNSFWNIAKLCKTYN